jgi:uncharacterized protein (DUF1501 family)
MTSSLKEMVGEYPFLRVLFVAFNSFETHSNEIGKLMEQQMQEATYPV